MQLQRRVELADGIDHMPGALLDFQNRLPCLIRQFNAQAGSTQARLHAGHRTQREVVVSAHHFNNFQSGRTRASRQGSDFIRHNGKSASMLACPRRLYRGIERQQIGLIGNPANGLHNLAYVV